MKKYLISLILLATIGCTKTPTDYNVTDRKIIQDYIASHKLTNVQSTTNGLYYVIETPGSSVHPTAYSKVILTYTGRLTNDTIFDKGDKAQMDLNKVIAGWRLGIPLFGRSGKGKLLIPSSLAYGNQPPYGIPAHAVLIFDINLLDFN